jgi:hypothetical protein
VETALMTIGGSGSVSAKNGIRCPLRMPAIALPCLIEITLLGMLHSTNSM